VVWLIFHNVAVNNSRCKKIGNRRQKGWNECCYYWSWLANEKWGSGGGGG